LTKLIILCDSFEIYDESNSDLIKFKFKDLLVIIMGSDNKIK